MIAVDRYWQGKGLGSDLAIDALARARNVADEVGLKLVVLDVIDDGGNVAFARRMAFYRCLGFQSFQDRPERMFLTIDTIRLDRSSRVGFFLSRFIFISCEKSRCAFRGYIRGDTSSNSKQRF